MRIFRFTSVSRRILPSNHYSTIPSKQDVTSLSPARCIAAALQEHINSPSPKAGKKIHADIIKTGFIPDLNISIKLLILHLKCGCVTYARQVFDELPKPTLSAYNYLISGYLKHGLAKEFILLVQQMAYSGEMADGYTLSMVLKASSSFGSNVMRLPRSLCKLVHARIIKFDVELDDVLITALVDSYVKSGNLECARTVFETMKDENVVCSTSMISGYMNQGFVEDAVEVFNKTKVKDIVVYNAMVEGFSRSVETAKRSVDMYISMQRAGFHPNISTFASVIGACSVLTSHEVGQQVHAQIMKSGVYTHIKMGSSLLDMYAKCGGIDDARRVFDQMIEKNVFSWTSMIDGYGKNGNPEEALQLFTRMKEFRVEPNYVTFLGALSACSHSGLVDKGYEIFESMQKDYFLKPKMEHYACMVDLMGRAGELTKAFEFVRTMPERHNSDVWAALLSSCNLHGNVDLASIAASELFKLNADKRPGAYLALSNVYASNDRWDNVSKIREVMKARKISKNIGRSWTRED
ncbi:PREDICTED: pentatricopeptide repeat-containing protein At1g28690, mitochondrial isoform X2 [Camelina sativa]|uniref:Pentatricopeptide repeat-containing protein At1g28690, mitochondrial isoform X2 n=1 Tax=Camelina sativa TaxID=90675 RepID=A0ABM0WZ42_CAMSA|nr:PREDICTED: pentatricopeptide repeat-containing protein At1g28690, mitochondrial isoform X2 [Camelina sativa]